MIDAKHLESLTVQSVEEAVCPGLTKRDYLTDSNLRSWADGIEDAVEFVRGVVGKQKARWRKADELPSVDGLYLVFSESSRVRQLSRFEDGEWEHPKHMRWAWFDCPMPDEPKPEKTLTPAKSGRVRDAQMDLSGLLE